ncbi:MAG: hypothetical protein ACWGNV_16315, partial [Bacteroidales bacterium]
MERYIASSVINTGYHCQDNAKFRIICYHWILQTDPCGIMLSNVRTGIIHLTVILVSGVIPALLCQLTTKEPVHRYYHIRNFRYGKDPHVIRCNRGDSLHLTFSSDDTGHSFFLEEFDVDVKVSPAMEEVLVFSAENPSEKPYLTKELVLKTEFEGLAKYLVSRSQYRCHVWCGPLHAFEQGKLIIMPNTLLFFSLGALMGLILVWIFPLFRKSRKLPEKDGNYTGTDLFMKFNWLRKAVVSRWPQFILTVVALCFVYIVILTSLFGTKMSGRNLGVVLMWIVWLFLLIVVLTPIGGRIWCSICPL